MMLTVNLSLSPAVWGNDEPRATLPRLPLPLRDHQSRGLAVPVVSH